ncbi:hemagglutinin [Mycoplasmopsis synoviae]|uniref:hemagglutinin n=1 Tax=Mycoplasmopsis synoviae TaxID=2109 RepID=UPI001CE0AE4F|nr:hemagglutinin [Mycoplasmopsis synoviae]UBX97929.1 hemagglutinin [Mycoplasmopsis synoviae]
MLNLYWDGFMPKIVVDDYVADTTENNKEEIKEANKTKLQNWFKAPANWEKLSEQLTKKLGADKFKNVKLTYKSITLTDFTVDRATRWYPTVKFSVEANEGYTLNTNSTREIDLVVRVLYKSAKSSAANVFTHEGASPSAAPSDSSVDDANVKAKVNVYLNYTGPSIVLDEAHPTVGGQENTSINGTSNVEGTFNDKFKELLVSVLSGGHAQSSLFQAIINYVNKFDPKFRAAFVTNSKNGVTITKVENGTQLRPGTLDDLVKNRDNVFLQQVHDDSSAVYFAVNGVGDNKWLSTFLIRIPLTKFVKPLTEFRPVVPSTPASPENSEEETQQDSQENNEAEQGTTGQTENNSTEEATKDSGSGSSNTDSSQNSDQQSQQSPQSQQQ